jgi:4-carboxymuconolactone decarboxylase
MRLNEPRLQPLDEADWDPDIADRIRTLGPNPPNVIRTLAHHPKLYKRWAVFGNHIMTSSTLPPREREILMLRIGWLCRSAYEFGQHTLIGRQCGLNDEEIFAITRGPGAPGWTDHERALLTAVDELKADAHISGPTWAELSKTYSTEQLLDLVFTVGQYNMVSMALNTLGVQLDPGVPGFPEGAG